LSKNLPPPGTPESPDGNHRPDTPTSFEQKILDAAGSGEPVGPDLQSELAEMRSQGISPTIRATVLRRRLVDRDWPVHARGVQLNGLRITGSLDLEGLTLRCPLRLENCELDESSDVNLSYATVSLLILKNCRIAGLRANSLVVTKALSLEKSEFTGLVRLADANITGQLNCGGITLTNPDDHGNSLIADRIKVSGGVFLSGFESAGAVRLAAANIAGQLNFGEFNRRQARLNGFDHEHRSLVGDGMKVGGDVLLEPDFEAAGVISLRYADIGRQLSCRGARLEGIDGKGCSMVADGMKVGGDVFLAQEFMSAGTVRLPGAEITGQLNCTCGWLIGHGDALVADRMKVGGDVFLNQGFTSAGTVRLPGADITGQLNMSSAQLIRPGHNGVALVADGMKVGSDIRFERDGQHLGFISTGTVSLKDAQVDGSLTLIGAELPVGADKPALTADGIRITGKLAWRPTKPVLGRVSLKGAAAAELDDNWIGRTNAYWPSDLRLDGFTYTTISADNTATLSQRLDWIRGNRTGKTWRRARRDHAADTGAAFASGPYEQLFDLYQRAGNDTDAREIAIVRRRDQRKFGTLRWYRKLFNQLLDYSIGYGYRTWEALAMLVGLYMVVLVITITAMHHNGSFVPVPQNALGIQPVPSALHCRADYPCFSAAGYAFDTVVPIINLHQADYWRPNAATGWGHFCLWMSWVGTILGWLLATLAVAGYTGLARHVDAPETH
jgi:hypothetical protein